MKAKLLAILCILLNVTTLHSQSVAFERLGDLNKGCNLSNWLEAFWLNDSDYPQSNIYNFEDIQAMKSAGMSGIRLNVNFERFLDENEPYNLDLSNGALNYIDSVLQWADSMQMMVVLVNQHGWDNLNDFTYPIIKPRMAALWEQLTDRYKSVDPELLILEIMNEPPTLLSRGKTRQLMSEILKIIRSHTTDHTVIVSGGYYSGGEELSNTTPLPDTNIIYTFHFYEPYWFTHQGASWSDIPYPIGSQFPHQILNAESSMRAIFWKVANWRTNRNVPVYLGELGTINYADEASKCNWIEFMGELIDQFEMPWAYWDCKYSSGDRFGFFDGDEISATNVRQCYAEALRLYEFNTTTNHYENSLSELNLFPNPSSKEINFTLNDSNISSGIVYNILGEKMLDVNISKKKNSIYSVNIELLQNGIYTLALFNETSIVASSKFMKL